MACVYDLVLTACKFGPCPQCGNNIARFSGHLQQLLARLGGRIRLHQSWHPRRAHLCYELHAKIEVAPCLLQTQPQSAKPGDQIFAFGSPFLGFITLIKQTNWRCKPVTTCDEHFAHVKLIGSSDLGFQGLHKRQDCNGAAVAVTDERYKP